MSSSEKMQEHIIKTALCSVGDLDARLALTFEAKMNTTLNYLYSVHQDVVPTKRPTVQYFGIGIQGFRNADDGILATPHRPSNEEMGLYTPIPFRCVPIDEDLSSVERQNYRMRVRQTINGTPYFMYYLKKLTTIDTAVQITQTNPITGAQEPYQFLASNLTPTPPVSATSGEQSGDVTVVNVGARVGATYYGHEVLEAINVLYDGDLRYAKVSEMGLFSGEDRIVNGLDANNIEFEYTEAIYAQLCYKICNTGSAVGSSSFNGTRYFLLGDGNLIVL